MILFLKGEFAMRFLALLIVVPVLLVAAYFYGENEDTRGLEQATKPL